MDKVQKFPGRSKPFAACSTRKGGVEFVFLGTLSYFGRAIPNDMSTQLNLFDLPASPKPQKPRFPKRLVEPAESSRTNDHLFLAIMPDHSTARRIGQLTGRLQAAMGLCGKPLDVNRLHVSLYSFGIPSGASDTLLHSIDKAATAVAATVPPFDVRFDRVGSFSGRFGKSPLVLHNGGDNAALVEFFERLGEELGGRGFNSEGVLRFTPHMTMLYGDRIEADEFIEPVSWTVTNFVLIHSHVGKGIYDRLNGWTLRGRA